MLRRQDVGHRVVVRRIVGVRGDRTLYSDALGELVELTETELTLATAQGPLRVPLPEVHRAKRVPPARRPTAAAVTAIELAANAGWPAPVQDRLGDWVLRAADGWTGRGNSALAVGDPDRPLEDAIDAVVAWYHRAGLPPVMNLPLPLADPVNVELAARGWTARPLTLVQTTPTAQLLAATAPAADLPPVRLSATPGPQWLDLVTRYKGELPPAAHHILTAVDRVVFAELTDAGGQVLAVARGSVTGAGRWLGVSLVYVHPDARRQGLARRVVGAVARWGAGTGATDAYLQVEERNTAAVGLYGGLGFRTHHTYLTRQAPGTG